MTHLEALQFVEEMATDLGLVDRWGDPLVGISAVAQIAKLLPTETYKLECQFMARQITPEQYTHGMKDLMDQFQQHRFVDRVERRIASLGEPA